MQHLVHQCLAVISPYSAVMTPMAAVKPPDVSQLQTSNSPSPPFPQDPIPTFSSTSTGFHGAGQCSSGSHLTPALPPLHNVLQYSPYIVQKPLLILLGFSSGSAAACGFGSGSGDLLMASSPTSAFQEEFTPGFRIGFWEFLYFNL